MGSSLTAYGLTLLWLGAMALMVLIVLRNRPLVMASASLAGGQQPRQKAKRRTNPMAPFADQPKPDQTPNLSDDQRLALIRQIRVRRILEIFCQFTGMGGVVAGLGLLALGAFH